MEISYINRFISILNRYKLAHRTLGVDDVELGGGHNIKFLKRYYFFIPLVIGSIIIITGFLIDFILLKFCGVPFLLYAIYGIGQINIAIKENRNTTVISNGEIKISNNDIVTTLYSKDIKEYEIKMESLDDELQLGDLLLIDIENNEHLILTLIDDELRILKDNLDFLKDFIQTKMNVTDTPLTIKTGI